MRGTLVVAQIAISLVLVVAAGLFLRTFASLNQLPLGFVPEPLLVVELNLQAGGGPPTARGARVERLRDAAAAVPGVRSASVSAIRLLTGGGWSSGMVGVGDLPMSRSPRDAGLWLSATTPGWFETMGMSLRSGQTSTPATAWEAVRLLLSTRRSSVDICRVSSHSDGSCDWDSIPWDLIARLAKASERATRSSA